MLPLVYVLKPPYAGWAVLNPAERVPRGSVIGVRPIDSTSTADLSGEITRLQLAIPTAPVILLLDLLPRRQHLAIGSKAMLMGASAVVDTFVPQVAGLRNQLTDLPALPQSMMRWLKQRGVPDVRNLHQILEEMLSHALEYPRLHELLESRGISDTNARRTFADAGIGRPGDWFQVFRVVLMAITLQRHAESPVAEIASRLRYFDDAAVRSRFRDVIGVPASDIRSHLGWEWLMLPAIRRTVTVTPAPSSNGLGR